MLRTLLLLYSALTYVAFFVTFLWAIAFVGCVGASKCVDTGAVGSTSQAILVDTLLLAAFAIQHSVMARRWFKQRWTKIVPEAAERTTYVLAATLLLALLLWQWRPMPAVVWDVEGATARTAFWALFALGWVVLLASTFMIDHFDLFGLRQAWFNYRNVEYTHPPFTTAGFYRYTRNPLMLGFVIAFWAAPTMTVGHLFFAIAGTAYILVGIALEEQDHAYWLGSQYLDYKARTSMIIPMPPKSVEGHAGARQTTE